MTPALGAHMVSGVLLIVCVAFILLALLVLVKHRPLLGLGVLAALCLFAFTTFLSGGLFWTLGPVAAESGGSSWHTGVHVRTGPDTVNISAGPLGRIRAGPDGVDISAGPLGHIRAGPDGVDISAAPLAIARATRDGVEIVGPPSPQDRQMIVAAEASRADEVPRLETPADAPSAPVCEDRDFTVPCVVKLDRQQKELVLRFHLELASARPPVVQQFEADCRRAARESGAESLANYLGQLAADRHARGLDDIRTIVRILSADARHRVARELVAQALAECRDGVRTVKSRVADGRDVKYHYDEMIAIKRHELLLALRGARGGSIVVQRPSGPLSMVAAIAIVVVAYLVLKTSTRRARSGRP